MTGIRALEVERVAFSYGRKRVLSHVDLSLAVGVNLILGRNGAGKTTLIRTLAGAARPSSGQVRLAGAPIDRRSRQGRAALRQIGWLPQAFGYPPHMTTREFVTYAAWLKEVPEDRIGPRTAETLAILGLAEQTDQPLRALSGGQLRRAGLAAAIAADPAVLILDEPTAGLDPEQRDGFHELIRQLRTEKIVIVATHLLEDVEALAGRIVVLNEGSVRWSGTGEELAQTADSPPGLHGLRQGFYTVLGQTR